MALGSFYPDVLLSGILWPIEGMPIFLRKIVYFLPQTFAIDSLRCVLSRGNLKKNYSQQKYVF
jgi:ABC-type multidrug transport system permease subunit